MLPNILLFGVCPVPRQVYLDGVHGDTCATLSVGEVDEEGERLMSTAKSCTQAAIAACSIGKQFDVIPNAIA